MKKASRIIISILLIAAMIVPAAIFANAEVNVSTTPSKQGGEPYEYYNLKDGLYTKKTVSGPLDNGNYQVELEAYTSDISFISAKQDKALDVLLIMDCSASMSDRDTSMINAAKQSLTNLVKNYNVGAEANQFKVNVAVKTYGNIVSDRLEYTELTQSNIKDGKLSKDKGKITKAIDKGTAGPWGTGTFSGDAFESAYTTIKERYNKTQNKQIIIFFTDGIPAGPVEITPEGTDDTFLAIGQAQGKKAVQYAKKLKDLSTEIYCVGMNSLFDSQINNLNKDTLKRWVVDGYSTSLGTNKGTSNIRKRQANVFLNILSSNWISTTDMGFDWGDFDSANAKDYHKNKNPMDYEKWAKNDDSWQIIPKYFTLNKETKKHAYYFAATDEENITKAVALSLKYGLAITCKSQGSLLGNYSIKDTVSDYFNLIQGTTKVYDVPYDYTKGAFKEGDDTDILSQYGARNRAWGAPKDITDKIQYTENNNSVEVLAAPENSSVIDTCVVDDIVDSSNEKHGGNKLRITFEIRPKDSFMGGSDVPTNIYKESGIFDKDGKAVQNFANLSATGILDTSSVPKLQVELVNANAHIDDDNVKIGYLYNLDDLGKKNLTLTYKGRYSNDEYTVKLKDSEYVVYDATGAEVKYSESKATDENPKSVDTKPDDYAEIIIGENYIDETLNNKGIVTNSKLIQFNSTGITQTDGEYSMQTPKVNKYVYLLWKGMKTSSTYLNERFPEYNKTGKDSKATTLDGIVNGIRYFSGREAIRQLDTQFNVNVFVPTIKVSDAISGGNSEYPYDSATVSDAFDKYSSQNKDAVNVYKNNEVLTSLVFAQIDVSAGEFVRLIPNGSTIIVNSTQHSGFISDAFSTSSASSISAYVKAFADKDGNIKTANSVISDKDQIKLTLSYNELADKTASFPTDAPFKFTVDEFWATNECSVCKDNEKYIPQFLGYQEQVHVLDRTSSITVNKTGCDANHTNESFVFSVLAFKSKSDNSGADLSSMKVLNNFTIQGNGQRTITVDNQYDYYCVVEDLNSLNDVISGWTWDYSGVSVNGINWDTIENNLFKLESKQIKMLTYNNKYDNNNNNLHYASAYASNIMSHDKVEVTTSPSNITK